MDEEKKQAHAEGCDCPQYQGHSCWHMHCHGHRHLLLRWLLGILILVVVFWLGLKIGEFKGAFGDYYSGFRMPYHMRYLSPQMYGAWGSGAGMMWQNYAAPTQPQTNSPSTTQPQK